MFALPMVVGLTLLSTPAAAQNVCGPRDDILELLGNRYAETSTAVGLASSGGVIEVLTSDDGGTWTIVVTMPDGTSCVVVSGEA
jgi:hypothetical protein